MQGRRLARLLGRPWSPPTSLQEDAQAEQAVPGDYKERSRETGGSLFPRVRRLFLDKLGEVCFPNTSQGVGCSKLET